MTKFQDEIDIKIIKSEMTNFAGAEVGIQVTHRETGISASSTSFPSQHKNKVAAIELLKEKIVKDRFENIDEADLMDGKEFFQKLRDGEYDED